MTSSGTGMSHEYDHTLAEATAIAIDRIGFENAPWAPNFALGRGIEPRQLQTG